MRKLLVFAICASFVACSNTSEKNTSIDTTASAANLKTDAVNPVISGDTAAAPGVPGAETTPAATVPAGEQPKPAQTKPAKPAQGGAAEQIKKGQALIAKSDCLVCHKTDVKLIGPAYADVAKKYPNTPANINMLAEKIIKGGAGVWGDMAMTPHPNIPMEDAKALAQYVLSVK